ncbi:LysR family transcriptional regulator [Ottowia thiooxydans]|uniref:LysR family malonate utilization transcriptional regulator n=1 Tax=Ottowia thiooxydans TaxID=219182 RepID=A0ABV2Q3I8_9BURK
MHRLNEDISSRKLEALVAYLDHKTLNAAADALNTSAVSVHRALHSLEDSVRCSLFRHEGRGLVPTEAAHTLAGVARDVLGRLDRGIEATRIAAGYASDRLKIGSLYSLTSHVLPELIKSMNQRRPNLQCELILGKSRHELLPRLKQGQIDAVFAEILPGDSDLVSLPMFEDESYFAAPLSSPLAAHETIVLSEHVGEKLVTLAEGPFSAVHLAERFKDFHPCVIMEVQDIFTQMNLVSSGVACAVVPGRIRPMYQHLVRFIPFAESEGASQTIGLSVMKARERDPNLLALSSVARIFVRERESRAPRI